MRLRSCIINVHEYLGKRGIYLHLYNILMTPAEPV